MKTSDFDFDLPQDRIAQFPLKDRSSSKLLVLHKENDEIEHKHFYDLLDYLKKGDVLVLNESRVLPARLFGLKEGTGAHIELLILDTNHQIEAMVRNARAVKVGTIVNFGEGKLRLKCTQVNEMGLRHFEMISEGIFLEILNELGVMPLPPYIKEKLLDPERYQTVYAKELGSAAAPTAGLHFTPDLLHKIEEKGVEIVKIVLHVGLGTFKPVDADDVSHHIMHTEHYQVSKQSADALNKAKSEHRRIIAVGTTSVRTLESQMIKHNKFIEEFNDTNIFITPGYTFKAVDVLVTNFHLPKSTLVMLVSAFYDKEKVLNAYQIAIENDYRFFSFGDAMLIL
jgi:S-adenosylmethionine:tRNA ribosyltransferase-isomerase